MRVNKSVIFGLVSLVCTVNATQAIMGQSPITLTSNGCTAICEMTNDGGKLCQAFCGGSVPTSHPATPLPTPTSTVMTTVTSRTKSLMTNDGGDDDCNALCVMTAEGLDCELLWPGTDHDCNAACSLSDELDFECDLISSSSSSTSVPATSTPIATTRSHTALKQRGVTITNGDCTALCWDLMPGTECDVQCSSEFKTEMPVPSKAAPIPNLGARDNFQGILISSTGCGPGLTDNTVQQVREARLARKFGGNVARDDNQKMEFVTTTAILRASETAFTTEIMPHVLFESMFSEAKTSLLLASRLSDASAAMSEATAATVSGSTAAELVSAASSLLAEVISSKTASSPSTPLPSVVFSSVASWKTAISVVPLPIFANATVAAPASTGSAPTVTATRTFNVSTATVSAGKTATYNSSKTTTASTTTTEALVVSQVGSPAGNYNTYSITTTFNGAPQYTGSSGLLWSLLVGLAANIAFLI